MSELWDSMSCVECVISLSSLLLEEKSVEARNEIYAYLWLLLKGLTFIFSFLRGLSVPKFWIHGRSVQLFGAWR